MRVLELLQEGLALLSSHDTLHTVGSKSVAMFGCFGLIATKRLLE